MGIETEKPSTIHILDTSPATMSRLIAYHAGVGYAATWVHIGLEGEDTEEVLIVVSSEGNLFTDATLSEAQPISKLPLALRLSEIPTVDARWSGAGVNRMLQGRIPNAVAVFDDVRTVVNHFMDFHGSFTGQDHLCELIACWTMATYFLDVIPVTGYLWPNGEPGSGKSHLLYVISTMAYLGQVITAGGSFAAIRDLAGYGGTLLFDDAEKIMDAKGGDPDKQALLLAGNRKGTTVPLKVAVSDRGWEMRHVNAYCPKAFSAIMLPIDTLASRTIFIPLLASDDSAKANSDPLDYDGWPDGIDRRRLVDNLWSLALVNMGNVSLSDKAVSRESVTAGRTFQPWRAVMAIAHFLEGKGAAGLYGRMNAAAKAYREDAHLSNSTSRQTIIMRALRRLVEAKLNGKPRIMEVIFATKELHEAVNQVAREMDLAGDDEDFITSKSLGWNLKRMRLDKPEARSANAREWKITDGQLQKMERARGLSLSDKTSQTAETSETSRPVNDVFDVNDNCDVSPEGDLVTDIPRFQETI